MTTTDNTAAHEAVRQYVDAHPDCTVGDLVRDFGYGRGKANSILSTLYTRGVLDRTVGRSTTWRIAAVTA